MCAPRDPNIMSVLQDFVRAFDEVARSNDRSHIKPATFTLHTRKVYKTYIKSNYENKH